MLKEAEECLLKRAREIGAHAIDDLDSGKIDLPTYMNYVRICMWLMQHWHSFRRVNENLTSVRKQVADADQIGPFIFDVPGSPKQFQDYLEYTRKLMLFERPETVHLMAEMQKMFKAAECL